MSLSTLHLLVASPRRRILVVLAVSLFLLSILNLHQGYTPRSIFPYRSCSPEAYASGKWTRGPRFDDPLTYNMTEPDDAVMFSGFTGCASSREFWWHLAADNANQYDRFPKAHSYDWTPGRKCGYVRPLDPEQLLKTLVEDGGWYLVGDSVTENHFFSLSCILHRHVVATPDYTKGGGWDRGWPQNLYLSPASTFIPSINFPNGFDIAKTPLVTFRRIDLLFSKDELQDIHRAIQAPETNMEGNTLFSQEAVWTIPSSEYLAEFTAPLPQANYATMVVSTAGHWTVTLLNQTVPSGIEGVLNLFEHAMPIWAQKVQAHIDTAEDRQSWISNPFGRRAKRRAVIRAYLPGHEDCHNHRDPWDEVEPFVWNWYNWGEIWKFNSIFEKLLSNRRAYRNIHYLGIDRPARLRPDAHTTGDCLHIMTGAGVLEGWTHYIWHYLTTEL